MKLYNNVLMGLFNLARKLQRSHLIFPSLFRITHNQLSPSLRKFYSFSSSFHRTHSLQFETGVHFSIIRCFSIQTYDNLFNFSENINKPHDLRHMGLVQLLKSVAEFSSEAEAMASLNESGIDGNRDLVYWVIWELREEWRIALLAFKWGEKWRFIDEKVCELMTWVLCNHNKFNLAWCLIQDLNGLFVGMRRPMLVMIDRYAAANNPGKAIRTFRMMDKFGAIPDEEAFHCLLKSLCKNGNIEEAEEFMLLNKKLFPLETEGFNIILNGWSNVSVDVIEAKRIWKEMSRCCITPNSTSYTHMISCFSKVGNLFDSLRLYNEMKKRDWIPGIEVYNSLIYVLTREKCYTEALKVLEKMKEAGLQPNCDTYNSLILPLCERKLLEEARSVLSTLVQSKLNPTIETYHAFVKVTGLDETFEVLDQMKATGLGPNGETFRLFLDKLFKLEQPENALKVWSEMKRYEVVADVAHYTLLVEGLARCGFLIKAREFYSEMRLNGIGDDPKLKKLLKAPAREGRDKRNRGPKTSKKDKQVSRKTDSEGKNRQGQLKQKKEHNSISLLRKQFSLR